MNITGYLTVRDVAARLDRSEPTAWRRLAAAGVPRYRDPATGCTLIAARDMGMLDRPVRIAPTTN